MKFIKQLYSYYRKNLVHVNYLKIFFDVSLSSRFRYARASSVELPHISRDGEKLTQTAGLSFFPNSLHRLSSVSCMQRTPAGLPPGIPGISEDMEGAMQHAPHPILHSIFEPLSCYDLNCLPVITGFDMRA
jgi:hypothetical protein